MTSQPFYGRRAHLQWDVDCLRSQREGRSRPFPLSPRALTRMYPTRALRYWFVHNLLRIEQQRLGRPLSVCEVGIHTGEMLRFLRSLEEVAVPIAGWSSWLGVDQRIDAGGLAGLGYTALAEENIERSDAWLSADPDVVILLHVLEHLYDPEDVVRKIGSRMRPGSVLIGGFPSVPAWAAKLREPRIRAHPNHNGHVSVFSPARLRRMAETSGLELDFMTGAFFLRADGSFLEDRLWWLQFNVAFGARVLNWPGELYWVMRKPADGSPHPQGPASTRGVGSASTRGE